MNIKSKNEEFALFNQLSDEWWNENGKFKILHQIKSLRMSYICLLYTSPSPRD